MGELVMTKNEGRLEFLDESIRFVAENGGIMKTDEFVAKEQQAHPGMDTTSCYHKIVMARYFGLVLYNKYSSYYFLTEAGTTYSRARSQNEKIDAILKALTSVTFGRNNNAVSSDSDIEAPVVMLKAVSAMGSASMTQIGLILYYMDAENKTLAEAIDAVQKLSNPTELRQQLTANKNSKYFDVKFNKLFEELGVVTKEQGDYILSEYVREKHLEFISELPEVKPIISKNEDISENIDSSDYKNIFSHNVYGLHIKMQNNALSEEHPHVCIGWSAMGDLSEISNKEELGEKYDATWPNTNTRKKGQDIGQVWRFVKEMQIGDYVVFADGDVCHIGQITSDYYFDDTAYSDQDVDYANTRDITWLKKGILRSELSEVFHRSLMTAMSVWTLNDYKSAVCDLLNNIYKKDDVELFENGAADEDEDIFSGFEPWLTSYDNPDYTGKQKYAGYVKALVKLIDFMYEQKLIDDSDLNDKSIEKYYFWLDAYNSSEVAKEYDEKKLSSKAGSAALKKYIKYVEYLVLPHAELFDYSKTKGSSINKIFYGTPGCGKSHHIQHNILEKGNYAPENVIRTTFYQDYSNTDFVGQILPKIEKDEKSGKETVKYIFNPGPFTLALIRAISNPAEKVALVVEEINRGNAPAIFGDIFQLLDRDSDGVSEYGIVNVSVLDYFNDYVFEVNGEKKNYIFKEIKIPGNMDIFATMNTSDQNVYTLDTAFVRRWDKEKIKNSFADCIFASTNVPGMDYTWQEFVTAINNHIAKHLEDLQVNEDKQIGVFFVKESLLGATPEKFAYKVFDYLWSDVAKLDHGIFFNHFDTLEALISAYEKNGVGVFKTGIFDKKETPQTVEEDENNE